MASYNKSPLITCLDTQTDRASNSGAFQFYTVNHGAEIAVLKLTSTENVGIGTPNPLSTLQISSQTTVATTTPTTLSLGTTYSSVAGANPKLKLWNDGSTLYGFGVSASEMDVIIPASASCAWFVGGSPKMILNTTHHP